MLDSKEVKDKEREQERESEEEDIEKVEEGAEE